MSNKYLTHKNKNCILRIPIFFGFVKRFFLIQSLFLFFPFISGASEDREYTYCEIQNLGWHFYCDFEVEEADTKQLYSSQEKTLDDYIVQRDALRREVEGKLARAVLEPTDSNIRDYIRTQKEKIMEPATKFTNFWSKLLWFSPDLDYTLQHPVSSLGKQAYNDNLNLRRKSVLKDLNKRYGIFFFYLSTCPYCHKYSTILKEFTQEYDLNVIAISMDGKPLPGWPDYIINEGQASILGISDKPVPATILFDNKNKRILPVGFGLMGMDELEQRIYTIVSQGEEYASN